MDYIPTFKNTFDSVSQLPTVMTTDNMDEEINEQYYFFLLCLRPSPVLPCNFMMFFSQTSSQV